MNDTQYRQWLIKEIFTTQQRNLFNEQDLRRKPIRILERIFDNI